MSKRTGVKGKNPHQVARIHGADKRRAAREERTTEQQLAALNDRPGNSTRERAKLSRQLKQEQP